MLNRACPILFICLLSLDFSSCKHLSPPQEPVHLFSSQLAYEHIQKIYSYGNRSYGHSGWGRTQSYLYGVLDSLGLTVEKQIFNASTPLGKREFINIKALHPNSSKSPSIWIATHYDSKDIPGFIGANDGASTCGIVLELARVLSFYPDNFRAKIGFIFFDGEESVLEVITAKDGIYGSTYWATDLAKRNLAKETTLILLDLLGDSHYPPLISKNSSSNLIQKAYQASKRLKYSINETPFPVLDDHVALIQQGGSAINLIGDFSQMPYWHTTSDTLDKIDQKSLQLAGELTFELLKTLQKPPL